MQFSSGFPYSYWIQKMESNKLILNSERKNWELYIVSIHYFQQYKRTKFSSHVCRQTHTRARTSFGNLFFLFCFESHTVYEPEIIQKSIFLYNHDISISYGMQKLNTQNVIFLQMREATRKILAVFLYYVPHGDHSKPDDSQNRVNTRRLETQSVTDADYWLHSEQRQPSSWWKRRFSPPVQGEDNQSTVNLSVHR